MKVVKYLEEHNGEQNTMQELVTKWTSIWHNVVTSRDTAKSILHQYFNQQEQEYGEAEKLRLIETAAKLIKSEIKSVNAR